ncbi:hypothetical protein F5876DRAFT_67874 [Lentinula aff. lateritia]|uniref:Uncharacterized protein n=1 Tax=Lentinula aff. lateritia TaxID=2804960 RepID=A0ACC1TSY3_9AGAR|nr:hypothetical protein F5876DRAFT_67874 [Lentinula aff. lateritia]
MSQAENEKQSRPASRTSNPDVESKPNQSRPASQASNRPRSRDEPSQQDEPRSQVEDQSRSASQDEPKQQPNSRPASQASNKPPSRPASQASHNSKPPSKAASRTSSPSITRDSRPPRTPRGRSRTPRSLSSASGSDEENRAPTPTVNNPEPELPDVDEEDGEGDNAVYNNAQGNTQTSIDDDGNSDKDGGKNEKEKKKRRRRGKKGTKGFGVDKWPHGDKPGRLEPPHGVNDWPHEDEEGEGVGTSGRVLQRPKGVRDFSPAYAASDAGSNVSTASSVSGLSLGDWSRSSSSLAGVDTWPYGDNPGIMVKPLDHWGKPITNPDGTLVQKENWTGLPSYDELRGMDLDTHDDHVIKLKLELDLDVAVEINARIHGDLTLALFQNPTQKGMFKRIARKRKRQEEEEALGLDEEVKEALGLGGVDSDSEESDGEESGSEENRDEDGKEEGESGEDEEEEEEEEGDSSDVDEGGTEVVDMEDDSESEEKPPTISKRALKKQARQQKIHKIRERHAIWRKEKLQLQVASDSKVSSTLKTTPSTTSLSSITAPHPHQHSVTTTTTTSPKSSPIKDTGLVNALASVYNNNNKGGLEKESTARPKSKSNPKYKQKPDAAVTHVKGNAAFESPPLSSPDKPKPAAGEVGAEGKKKQAATRRSGSNVIVRKKKEKEKKDEGKREIGLSNEGDIDGYVDEGEAAKVKPRTARLSLSSRTPTRTNTTTTAAAVASAVPPKSKKPKHQHTPKDIDTKLSKKGIRKKYV